MAALRRDEKHWYTFVGKNEPPKKNPDGTWTVTGASVQRTANKINGKREVIITINFAETITPDWYKVAHEVGGHAESFATTNMPSYALRPVPWQEKLWKKYFTQQRKFLHNGSDVTMYLYGHGREYTAGEYRAVYRSLVVAEELKSTFSPLPSKWLLGPEGQKP